MALTNEDLQAIAQLLQPLKKDIKDIQLTLETETNRNIKLLLKDILI